MSLPRISGRNQSNRSNGVADILTNWGTTGPQGKGDRRIRRQGSQEDLTRAMAMNDNDLQVVSTQESPRQNNSMNIEAMGGVPLGKDFREEFQINSRGPFRLGRPMSNQTLQPMHPSLTEIQLPPSLSNDKMMKFSANVDGKALLHDLDQKFEAQDRMINFLISQLNSVEANMQSVNRKAQSIQDLERDARSKLENSFKFTHDQTHYSMNEIVQKINGLEDSIRREEKVRMEMRDKLRVSEEQNREMANFIKSLQNQSDQELTQMRAFLQEKLNDDHLTSIKSKEKSTILFNEVVRLGQDYEKQLEFMQSLNQNYENRIQTLESRLQGTEQNTMAQEKRTDVNSNMLNEVIERLESKLLNMEQNFHFMRNEQSKERENLSRLEISSLRYNEDFKNVLGQVQNEFQGRLELKMTDLVNRLLLEQEDRQRLVDDIRYQIDMKDKLSQEKAKHEREEMRDRYSAMDAVVRSEFQRKDEAIMSLQNSLETQIRTINGWVKQEELARTQQEISLRTEIGKVADSVKYDVEGFKGQQVQVTEKLSEMIKMEVDSRLSSDKETKALIQNLIKNVMIEVSTIKDASDKTLQKLVKDVKDTASDSAERAHFLSRYIDEEILKIGQKVTKQIEGIKTLCAKLTEQFKKHLINHENMKKDVYKRFEIIESHLPIYRSELYKLLEGTEARCLGKMKEVKDAIEQTMLTNFQVLDERVDQFSELVDSNMETLRKALQDNREVFVSVVNKTNEETESRYNAFVEDLEKIVNEVYAMQVKVDEGDRRIGDESGKINKMVYDLEAHINTSVITEKSVRKAQDAQLAEEIDNINKKLQIVAQQIQIQIDSEGNSAQNKNQIMEQDLKNNKRDIDKFAQELMDLTTEMKAFKTKTIIDTHETASQLSLEVMTSKLEHGDIHLKLAQLMKTVNETDTVIKEKFETFLKETSSNTELEDQRKKKMDEVIDLKIHSAFESMKGDNLFIWKQSLELAQKEFSEKGVGQTMQFLPKTLLDKSDLKRTVNSLILEESAQPKPSMREGAPQIKVVKAVAAEEAKDQISNRSNVSQQQQKAGSKQATPNQSQQQQESQQKQGSQQKDELQVSGATGSQQKQTPQSSSQQKQI